QYMWNSIINIRKHVKKGPKGYLGGQGPFNTKDFIEIAIRMCFLNRRVCI
ncbi:hypothetical protein ACJX0J_033766, partial [Zea mays]